MDGLRGLMVVLMVQGHLLDAWLDAGARASGYAPFVRNYLNAIPARAFLFLLGLGVVLRLERPDGTPTRARLGAVLGRGVALLAIAYLFRFQQLAMRGFEDWDLGRVDILNCLAATMLLVGLSLAPLPGRARPWTALALAGIFFALGPVLGTTRISQAVPEWLTAYLGGPRPLAWFPLFPWAGWGFLGAAAARIWLWAAADPPRTRPLFIGLLLAGLALAAGGLVLERALPRQYPSEIDSDMGFARTTLYLGLLALVCAGAGLLPERTPGSRALIQLGRASLVIYWVHIELVYGRLFAALHDRLSLPQALLGLLAMLAAMFALAWFLPRRRKMRDSPELPEESARVRSGTVGERPIFDRR
jgi:uncharacterized membrane protein